MVQRQHSPELVAANDRLLHLRAQYRSEQTAPVAQLQLEKFFQRETKLVSDYANRLELNTAGSTISSRF